MLRANKVRPIVVKFRDTTSKMIVKDALRNVNLRSSRIMCPSSIHRECNKNVGNSYQSCFRHVKMGNELRFSGTSFTLTIKRSNPNIQVLLPVVRTETGYKNVPGM